MSPTAPAQAATRRRIVYKAMLETRGEPGAISTVYLLPKICENLTAMNRDFHKKHCIRIGEKTYRLLSMWIAKEEQP